MRVAVVDCSVSGHRETYYNTFARTWAKLGHEVLLIAPQQLEAEEAIVFEPIVTRPLLPLPVGQPLQKKLTVLRNALLRLQNLASLRRQLKPFRPHLVYFPCLDDLLPTLAPSALAEWLMPYTWSGLLVQSDLPPYKVGMPDVRPFLRTPRCRAVGVLNEYSAEALKSFHPNILRVPDFADLSAPDTTYRLLHTLKERADGRKVIALLGSIGTRKGVELLLNVVPTLPAQEYFFLIAGKSWLSEAQTARLRAIETSHSNCLFALSPIPNEACFNALIAATDVVFAAYLQFTGSSNLLTKAAAFAKPVLVSQGRCMGKRVTLFGTGEAIAEGNVEACRAAIVRLAASGAPNPEGYQKYLSQHNLECLTEYLKQNILEI